MHGYEELVEEGKELNVDENVKVKPTVECTVDRIVEIFDKMKAPVTKGSVALVVGALFTSDWGLDKLINWSKWTFLGPVAATFGTSLVGDGLIFLFRDAARIAFRMCDGNNVENGALESVPEGYKKFFSSTKTTGHLLRNAGARALGISGTSSAMFAIVWSMVAGKAAPPVAWANMPYFVVAEGLSAGYNFYRMMVDFMNDTCVKKDQEKMEHKFFDCCWKEFDFDKNIESEKKEEFKCECQQILNKVMPYLQKGTSIVAGLSLAAGLILVAAASYQKEGSAENKKLMSWAKGVFVGSAVAFGLSAGADLMALAFSKCCKSSCIKKAEESFIEGFGSTSQAPGGDGGNSQVQKENPSINNDKENEENEANEANEETSLILSVEESSSKGKEKEGKGVKTVLFKKKKVKKEENVNVDVDESTNGNSREITLASD